MSTRIQHERAVNFDLTTVSMVFGAATVSSRASSWNPSRRIWLHWTAQQPLRAPPAGLQRVLEQHGLSPTLGSACATIWILSHLRVKRRSCDAAAEARGHGRVDESTILDALSPLLRSEVCVERCRRVIRASPRS